MSSRIDKSEVWTIYIYLKFRQLRLLFFSEEKMPMANLMFFLLIRISHVSSDTVSGNRKTWLNNHLHFN
jgi:hypothetical protein